MKLSWCRSSAAAGSGSAIQLAGQRRRLLGEAVDGGDDAQEPLALAQLAAPDAGRELVAEEVVVGALAGEVVADVGLEARGVDAGIDGQPDAARGGVGDDLRRVRRAA